SAGTVDDTVTMTALEFAGFNTIDLGAGTDLLNVLASGNISMLGTPTVSASVESGKLIGSAGIVDDTVTLSGEQLNAILGTAGTIDLYDGTDTINLTSTSIKLNTLENGSMSGVEAISASTATSGVTITLS